MPWIAFRALIPNPALPRIPARRNGPKTWISRFPRAEKTSNPWGRVHSSNSRHGLLRPGELQIQTREIKTREIQAREIQIQSPNSKTENRNPKTRKLTRQKKNRSGKYPRTEISRNGISEDLQKWKSPEMEISKMEISSNGIVRNVPPQNVYPPKWHSTKCLPSNVSPKYIPLQSSASPMHFLCIPNVFPILPTRIAYYEGRRRRYRVGLVRIPENDDQFPLGILTFSKSDRNFLWEYGHSSFRMSINLMESAFKFWKMPPLPCNTATKFRESSLS